MKIGFLTIEYPHPRIGNSGGIGTAIYSLVRGLKAQGHEITVIVYGQPTDSAFEEDGIQFYTLENKAVKGFSMYLTQKKIQRLVNTLYAKNQIEVLEVPDWQGVTAYVKSDCPLMMRLHGSDTYFCYLEKRKLKWRNRLFEKRAYRNATGIIPVSDYTGKMSNLVFGCERDYKVVPNGVDLDKFQPETQSESNIILYFGTLIRKKGLLELPHIFNAIHQKNPEAQLVLVGKDAADVRTGATSVWKMMQPLFDEQALKKVNYVGPVPYEEMRQWIAKATVCVFPTYAEALPVSWLEAMAMQKPVVASNIGWAPEIIEHGKEGYLAHPTAHQEYAKCILNLLENNQLASEMAKAARLKIEAQFSIEKVATQLVTTYQEILQNKKVNPKK
ncbi:MAG: hypothetical protein RL607_547 [Bacteroidota bacterium]|jgi:glycosyltransferase involved in cell wall biosynthesis